MSKITKERKIAYYIGMAMMALGFVLFISTFFDAASFMDDPFSHTDFGVSFTKPVIGMILMIAGIFVMNIGAKGTAGSGLILDPQKAREDLKPFSEAKGGMIEDVISNIDTVDRIIKSNEGKEIIKIRCRSCNTLNDEDAKYCKECGKEL